MNTLADLVEKHCKPSKRSGPNRANHAELIATMPQATTGEQFTKSDIVKFTGLDESVISLVMRELVRVNKVSEKVIDEKGTIGFRFMPEPILTKAWRRTEPDLSYTPKYF